MANNFRGYFFPHSVYSLIDSVSPITDDNVYNKNLIGYFYVHTSSAGIDVSRNPLYFRNETYNDTVNGL